MLQWLVRFDTGRIGYVYSLELFANGDVLAIFDDSIVQAVLRITSTGDIVWAKTFSGLTGVHAASTVGEVAIVGGDSASGPVLVELDGNGAITTARTFGGVGAYAR